MHFISGWASIWNVVNTWMQHFISMLSQRQSAFFRSLEWSNHFGLKGKVVGIRKLVFQSGVSYLIRCILEHGQHPLVDFLKFQPVDFWKISTRASVHLNKHENPYYIFRDLFHPFCSNTSTVTRINYAWKFEFFINYILYI